MKNRKLERQIGVIQLIKQRFEEGEISCIRDQEGKVKLTILVYPTDQDTESLGKLINYDLDESHLAVLQGLLLSAGINSMEGLLKFLLETVGIPNPNKES